MSPSYSEKAIATRIATEQKRLGNNGVVAGLSSTRSGRVMNNSSSPYENNTSVKPPANAPPLVSMTVPVTEVPAQVVMPVQATEPVTCSQSCISVQCVAETCAVLYAERILLPEFFALPLF